MIRRVGLPLLLLVSGLVAGLASDAHRSTKVGDLQPRLQWTEHGGYCGETSIQTAALHYGVWVSQGEVRRLAGGEVLLGNNAGRALHRLRFTFQSWDPNGRSKPRLPAFMTWLKQQLRKGYPCIMGVYIAGGSHEEYDHILPVVGMVPENPDAKVPVAGDQFMLHTLFTLQVVCRRSRDLGASRSQCRSRLSEGGNIPEDTPYGLAVTGVVSPPGSPPVQLAVDRADEPNPHLGQAPCGLHGTVTVSRLKQGKRYVLLRTDVPHAASFRKRVAKMKRSFQATTSSWVWDDPDPIPSDGITYYRCLPAPGTAP